jgi:hypothetical protein
MSLTYEWDIETVDMESGDILDHNHAAKLSEFSEIEIDQAVSQFVDELGQATRLVLVRDSRGMVTRHGRTVEHLDRTWAYVTEAGALPATFDSGDGGNPDGYKVPARFHAELKEAVADSAEALGREVES